MAPDKLVDEEGSATIDTEDDSVTVALAETLVLADFFPLAGFLALRAEKHLLAM